MFEEYREQQFNLYNQARNYFIYNNYMLSDLEKFFTEYITTKISNDIAAIERDFNEASYLYPFWQNYPPDERGRQPRGDQFPWIEVGEHVLGSKICRYLSDDFDVRDIGLPTGPDQRFLVTGNDISQCTNSFTSSCWLFIDIKSVGPRDDHDHAVMSHTQISGCGKWIDASRGVINDVMIATGIRSRHEFHCSVPPLYVLSNGTIAPVVLIVIKLVYKMLNLTEDPNRKGQPLSRITAVCIPNGLMLEEGPKYLQKYPALFFPGKDDKSKNPLKVRCRVSFEILRSIDSWRVVEIDVKNI